MTDENLYVQKGQEYPTELYDIEKDNEPMEPYYARCANFQQAQLAARDALEDQRQGLIVGDMKLHIWKSRRPGELLEGFPWRVKWVRR